MDWIWIWDKKSLNSDSEVALSENDLTEGACLKNHNETYQKLKTNTHSNSKYSLAKATLSLKTNWYAIYLTTHSY